MGAQGAKNVDSGNEWATPDAVVQEAAAFFGIQGFDLDPAANAANAKAPAFFDRDADGTVQDWHGYVWLNPPFSRSMKACANPAKCQRKTCRQRGAHLERDQHGAIDFAVQAVRQLEKGNVEGVAWHGPVAPDTDWFGLLWPHVEMRFDYADRIGYNGEASGGTFPSQTMFLRAKRNGGEVPTRRVPIPRCNEVKEKDVNG